MEDAILDRLRKILVDVVGEGRVPAGLDADTALRDGGLWLDSIELLQVVLASEHEFGITFEAAHDLVGDGLQTLRSLAEIIRRRTRSLPTAAPSP